MNHSERRSNLRPRLIALVLALCVLVAATAAAPGWMNDASSPAATVATTPEVAANPAAVVASAVSVPPDTIIEIADPEPTESTDAATDTPAAEAHEPLAAVLPEVPAAIVFPELHRPGGARSGANDGAGPAQFAALGGPTIGTVGGGKPSGEGAAPVEPMPAKPPSNTVDDPHDDAGDGNAPTTDPLPPQDPIVLTPIDSWPGDDFPIDEPVTEPVSVPEPATLGLLALGLAGMAGARRRRAARRD